MSGTPERPLEAELDAILADNGMALCSADIEAYIRDELSRGQTDPLAVANRALAGRIGPFRAPEQEDRFRGLVTELFEHVKRSYVAAEDRIIGEIRFRALELAQRDLAWLRSLDQWELPAREIPSAEIAELAEQSRLLSALIDATNHLSDSELDDESTGKLREALDGYDGVAADIRQRAWRKVDKVLAKKRRSLYRGKGRRPKPRAMIVLKISLKGIEPAIWRRIAVPDSYTLLQLHGAIQEAMGWTDSHLHLFEIGEIVYSDPDSDEYGDMDYEDEKRHRLSEIVPPAGRTFRYVYDFGDSWHHTIKVEKRVRMEPDAPPGATEPTCVGGARACPPEDCGGVPGYRELVDALRRPESKRTEDMRQTVEWAGDWEPERFDVFTASRRIRELLE